jgi:glycosyltransferase involved in cell wall biosynthesis
VISIGLPAVKPQFLAEAIGSVLNQTYPDFELIIFNDRCDSIIRNIVHSFTDSRIRYVETGPVLPVVENWNRVLSYAQGEYFVLFSDDDRYHPDFLLEMTMLFDQYPECNIAHCRVRKINAGGEVLEQTAVCPGFESGLEFIFHRLHADREQFAPEFVVRTKKIRDNDGFVDLPMAWGSDDLTWFSLAMEGGIAYSTKLLVDWRQSAWQISSSGSLEERLLAIDLYAVKLKAFIATTKCTQVRELQVLERIWALIPSHSARNKEHLLVVYALNSSFHHLTILFLKHRRRHHLKLKWLLYSWYVKLIGRQP